MEPKDILDKKTIIDGIDVSGCEHCVKMTKYRCIIQRDVYKYLCEENPNCYYKQLARYKQAIEKIKEIAENGIDDKEIMTVQIMLNGSPDPKNKVLKQILQKIKECEVNNETF